MRIAAAVLLTVVTVVAALYFSRCKVVYCVPEFIANTVIDNTPRWPQHGSPEIAGE